MPITKQKSYILEVRPRDQPTASPIAYILVERQEVYEYVTDDLSSALKASIQIKYQWIGSAHVTRHDQGSFCGSYNNSFDRSVVSLTSSEPYRKGAVYVELSGLKGHRIGTYFFNAIVEWAKQWPEASVNKIELIEDHGHGDNKIRRNRLYEQFGIMFDYADTDCRTGHSLPMKAENLTTTDAWQENIDERQQLELLSETLCKNEELSKKLEDEQRSKNEQRDYIRGIEKSPLTWALKTTCRVHCNFILGSSFFAVMATVIWFKL